MIALALFGLGVAAVLLLCAGVYRWVFPRRHAVVIERLDPKGGRL